MQGGIDTNNELPKWFFISLIFYFFAKTFTFSVCIQYVEPWKHIFFLLQASMVYFQSTVEKEYNLNRYRWTATWNFKG